MITGLWLFPRPALGGFAVVREVDGTIDTTTGTPEFVRAASYEEAQVEVLRRHRLSGGDWAPADKVPPAWDTEGRRWRP